MKRHFPQFVGFFCLMFALLLICQTVEVSDASSVQRKPLRARPGSSGFAGALRVAGLLSARETVLGVCNRVPMGSFCVPAPLRLGQRHVSALRVTARAASHATPQASLVDAESAGAGGVSSAEPAVVILARLQLELAEKGKVRAELKKEIEALREKKVRSTLSARAPTRAPGGQRVPRGEAPGAVAPLC